MKTIKLSQLTPQSVSKHDYYGGDGELLVSKGITISPRHLDLLARRKIQELHYREQSDSGREEIEDLLSREFDELSQLELDDMGNLEQDFAFPPVLVIPEAIKHIKKGLEGVEQLNRSKAATALDEVLEKGHVNEKPEGEPLSARMTQISVEDRTTEYKNNIAFGYHQALESVKSLLNSLAGGSTADGSAVRNIVEHFMHTFISDKNILLNIAGNKCARGDYLYHHSLNVCLLSMNIAASAGYSELQVFEIGMGALLHDIGMLLIPHEIKFKNGKLASDDWFEIQKHPIMGLHLLEKISRLLPSAPLIAYQVHERENGIGYPRRRKGRFIHRFAKIVTCADIYESMSSPRAHRPPLAPYNAMETLLKMARGNLIDPTMVRAFLMYVSLFPVGSIVELSDGRIGRVVDANGTAFTKPRVSIILDANRSFLPEGSLDVIDLKTREDVQIVKSHRYDFIDEKELMRGF